MNVTQQLLLATPSEAKEKMLAYEATMRPLVIQLVDLCKQHGVALYANFNLGQDAQGGWHGVTTNLPNQSGDFPPENILALHAARKAPNTNVVAISDEALAMLESLDHIRDSGFMN